MYYVPFIYIERVTRRRMYYLPFIYWGREGDKKKNVLCTFHLLRVRGWQEQECIMYLSYTEGERVTRTRMYYVPFIYWGWEGDKNKNVLCTFHILRYYLPFIYWEGDKKKNVLCTFHILRLRGWQEEECIISLSYTEGEGWQEEECIMYLSFTEGERVTRTRMYYVSFIYWGWEGDKNKNVLCTFHILRVRGWQEQECIMYLSYTEGEGERVLSTFHILRLRGWQEEECIMYLSYTEGERVTRRRMYYLPFIYWGREGDKKKNVLCTFHLLMRGWQEPFIYWDWEGDKKKNVLSPFHILRERGWQEEECIMCLSYTEGERVRGWQEQECIMYLSYTEVERVTRRRMYYVPFIYWDWEGDKKKNVLSPFHILRERGWQEEECIMYLSFTEGERVTRTRMYYVSFIYWGWEGDKNNNVLCTFHILRVTGWQEQECIMYLSYTEGERVTRRRMYYVPFIYWVRGWEEECIISLSYTEGERVTRRRMCMYLSYTEGERVTRRRMYYVPFIYWGRVRGWQEQECIMYLSYTEVERVTRRRMYYVPFIYWDWEGDKKKNVLSPFHILRERGWQEEECIMYLSFTEGERVTRTRMYYVPFIYWGWEGDKNNNVLCTFHILRVRGWQEQECIMYLSYTEGERVTRRRMYYVPFIYWGWEGERVTRTRMYYVPFIYWGWEGDKKKNVLCTFHILRDWEGDKKKNVLSPFHILRERGWQEEECIMYLSYTEGERVTRTRMYYVPFIYWGWEGYKKKNVLCAFHILRVEGERVTRTRMYYVPFIYRGWEGTRRRMYYVPFIYIERVTRRRMYYVPFIYWDWEGDKKKNVLSPFHILRERGWQEEECIMYLSFTEGERVTRTRMYYVPFIYWGWEGDKNKNVLCTFHILRVTGWQEQECIMSLSYTEGERVTRRRMYYVPFIYWGWEGTRRRMYYVPFIYWGWEGERVTRRRMYYVPFIYWGWEGDKEECIMKKNVLCTFHILRVRGWQEEECIMYLSYTEGERVTRRRMYYVPFIYWGWEGDKNNNVLCTFHILRVRGWQEQECIMYLSYTEGERVTRRRMYYVPFIYWEGERVTRTRMYYVPFIYWDWEGDKKKNVLCTFHILRERGWQEEECIMYLSYTEGERVTRTMYYVPFIYWGWQGDKNKNVLCTFHILRVRGLQEEECIMCLSYTEGRGWEGDKNKNVLCTFHIPRLRGWQEEECIMYLSYTEIERVTRRRMYYVPFIYWGWEGDKKKNVLCTFHILRLRGWQEEECIMSLSYTEGERVTRTRTRMYYVPFHILRVRGWQEQWLYLSYTDDRVTKNVLCTFHILRVRGWQEEECIMYLSYTEGERVTRRRMYYVPFIYWGWEGERVTRTRMYYVPFIYWETRRRIERVTRRRMYYLPFIYFDKKKNVLCTFHLLRERGWQEQECIMYLSYTEGERVTRTTMYYVPFIYWGWEGDKNKNVLCTFHILRVRGLQEEECIMCLSYTEERVRGWQEQECIMYLSYTEVERVRLRGWQEEECIMYLSYTEGERVTRRRMYYVPFIYWGWEGDKNKKKNVLCPFHYTRRRMRRVRGWQECIMYLSYTDDRVTRTRMYYVPFIYWGWEGYKKKNVLCAFHILRVRGWEGDKNKNVLCTFHIPWEGDKKKNVLCTFHILRLRGWQEENVFERVTRRRMYYVPFIYWDWEGDKKKNVLSTFHILRERGWQEEECIMYLSYTEGERVTRTRMYYVPFIYWGWEGDKNKNVLCTFHILRVRGWRRMYYLPFIYWGWEGDKKKNVLEGERVTRRRMYYVPFIYWGWEGDKKKNVLCTFHILRLRGWQEEECIISLSYTEGERVTRRRMYYVPFIYWGWEGDKKKNVLCTFHILREGDKNVLCTFHILRVRGWQEQECIMYLSYTEGERVTRRRMYYVPFIYWGWEGERVTRTRMYYVPVIYRGWEGDKKKNVLCTFHILRLRGWQEEECIMYLSYWGREGDKKKNVLWEVERVTRTFHIRMYVYVPFIYWDWEGDKKKNVLSPFHILRERGWQEEECIMYLSFTEGERVRRTRMYYVSFIYWGWEGDKNNNVLCTFHILRVRG